MITPRLVPRDRFRADWYEALRRRGATHEAAIAQIDRAGLRASLRRLGWWAYWWGVWGRQLVHQFFRVFLPGWWAMRPRRHAEDLVPPGAGRDAAWPPSLPGDRRQWH